MNPEQVRKLQVELNNRGISVPITGVLDQGTIAAMTNAVSKAVASNPRLQSINSINSPEKLVNAYMSNDWSSVSDVTGKPFSAKMQRQAETQAERALAPGFREQQSYDEATVRDDLAQQQGQFGSFLQSEARTFGQNKEALDQSAVDNGVLFAGSRYEKERDLKNVYQQRQAAERSQVASNIGATARDYQYQYGNQGANRLSDMYRLGSGNTFNPNVAGGQVKQQQAISDVYSPDQFKFQGRQNVANKAAVQTRATGLLSNQANKLSMQGYNRKY
jgi:hypothetical protein